MKPDFNVKNSLIILFSTVAFFGCAYFSVRILVSFNKFPYEELDFNCDGRTGLWEMIEGTEVHTNEVEFNGMICKEYYNIKVLVPFLRRCPDQNYRQVGGDFNGFIWKPIGQCKNHRDR